MGKQPVPGHFYDAALSVASSPPAGVYGPAVTDMVRWYERQTGLKGVVPTVTIAARVLKMAAERGVARECDR